MHNCLAIILSCYIARSLASWPEPTIHIQQGYIRGTVLTSFRSNNTFYGFMGIPYAKPPVGDLKFKVSQPAEPWSGIRNTTKEGSSCPQIEMLKHSYIGDEDCLFINVFAPKLPSDLNYTLTPVMVWIHGGDYICGSGDREVYGPDFLVDEGVILVTFNYRLGVLGFLSLQNEEVPGNNGMKDQLLALKWVKQNIHNFGGDPNNVTLFGESAGASSVHLHILSPMSQGLFHRAISESGSALNPWAYQTPESSLSLAILLGEEFGAFSRNPSKIFAVLKKVRPKHLVEFVSTGLAKPKIDALIGPTTDVNAAKGELFLPDTPISIINSGNFSKVPYMTGVNSEEALLVTRLIKPISWLLRPEAWILGKLLPFFIGKKVPKAYDMALEVKNLYFNNSRPIVLQYIDVITDLFFINGVYCTIQKQSELSDGPVYSYEFTFNGTANVFKKLFGGSGYPGACHADEIPYLFRITTIDVNIEPGTTEYNVSSRMAKLWTNFAKTGNPTPEMDPLLQNITWKPIKKSNFPYLIIDTDLKIKQNLKNGRGAWWEKLYKKYVPSASPCWPFH